MNKSRLFKKGDIIVCIDPAGSMYNSEGVDQLEFGKTYKIYGYKDNDTEFYINIYLEKWNGFSGNIKQGDGNCTFWDKRFILRSSITDAELVFMKVKYKLGIKYES